MKSTKTKLSFLFTASALSLGISAQAADFNVADGTTLSISGLIAAGVKYGKVTNTSRDVKSELRIDDNTSRLVVSGKTKFNSNLSGLFRIESRFTTDTRPGTIIFANTTAQSGYYPPYTVSQSSGWADGDTWVGFSGSWGQAVLGKSTLYYADGVALPYFGNNTPGEAYRVWDTQGFETFNILSAVGAFGTLGRTRSQNVIRYESPKFSGADVAVAYSKNPLGDEAQYYCTTPANAAAPANPTCSSDYAEGGTWYMRARYDQGPLSGIFSLLNQKINGGAFSGYPKDVNAYRLGVGYTFTSINVRVGLLYDRTSIKNGVSVEKDASRGAWMLPVSYYIGNHALHLSYAIAGNTTYTSSSGANEIILSYDYKIDPRAYVGVMFNKLRNSTNGTYSPLLTGTTFGGTAPGKGEGWQQISFGVNYWF